MNLIIVESPAKSKTIQKFLGQEYKVVSSFGHVRDLPKTKIGIDVNNDFKPEYVVMPGAVKNIGAIKKLVKKAKLILLATDPDREGEAISWHLTQALGLGNSNSTIKNPKQTLSSKSQILNVQRIVFHEITKSTIEEALKNPREIDMNLVNSQQARRILDRLVGYKLSPFLWKKIARGLSAGRVQSVALKFVVDREKERQSFQSKEYWSLVANFSSEKNPLEFSAQLIKIKDQKIDKFFIISEPQAQDLVKKIENCHFLVSNLEKKAVRKNPLPPFITSSLQQESYKKLRFSSKMTMRLAQQLYEKGLITYHRTDSYNLSESAKVKAKEFILANYGSEYWSGQISKKKSQGAQEAHEAIRPVEPNQSPEQLKNLDKKQLALYTLVWKRFIAALMSPAIVNQVLVEIETKPEGFTFRATGQTIQFDGFLRVYPLKMEEKTLPILELKEMVRLLKLDSNQHFTQPPARYNEASLIKALEEKGIGRPSTYVPILSVIQERNYIDQDEERRFKPTEIGVVVSDLLSNHFPDIVDSEFTAQMETKLDDIADGKTSSSSVLNSFYLPFEALLKKKEEEIDKKEITEKETVKICEKCGSKMILKIGRFGNFLACSNYPQCKNTKSPIEVESEELCQECGGKMVMKRSRFGSFWGCSNYPNCQNTKSLIEATSLSCPKCKEGYVIKRKSKKNKFFYGCSRYPKCNFIANKIPNPEKDNN